MYITPIDDDSGRDEDVTEANIIVSVAMELPVSRVGELAK